MSALSTLATVPFRSDIYVWSPVVFTSHRYVIVKLVRSSRSRVSSTFCGTGSTQSGTTGVKAGVALSRLSNTVQLRYREPSLASNRITDRSLPHSKLPTDCTVSLLEGSNILSNSLENLTFQE